MLPKMSRISLLGLYFFIYQLIFHLTQVQSELFTAQVELEKLFTPQASLVRAVEKYLTKERARLDEVQRFITPLKERGLKKPQEVISNPISAFLLVKGLSVDLDDLITLTEQKTNTEELSTNIKSLKSIYHFPSSEDLNGAATALTRLQDTYLLDTGDIAKGELNGHCCTSELSVDDCFELGRQSYNAGDYEHTILWMNEALLKSEEAKRNLSNSLVNAASSSFSVSQADILEYLAFSTYQKGEIRNAITLTEQLLAIDPSHPRASGNIGHYERILDERKGEDGRQTDQTFTIRERREDKVGWEKAKYEALCRGENQRIQRGAKCQYLTNGNPFLLIAPIKQEIMHLKPNIYIFHDVIYEKEMEIVKQMATPRFKRATVHNHVTGELVTANYRISKSAWLQTSEHPAVERINKRITDITGLDLETAEELQVVNYGLAGHYEPHYDFARREEKDAFKSLGTGNRIATFLFYMSEVDAGGATVFPSLDLTLWPKKGSAAFWYNLFEDGKGDLSTRHAGCPVLLGTKWVSNKWIHERGQEFRRPCKLRPSASSPNVDE